MTSPAPSQPAAEKPRSVWPIIFQSYLALLVSVVMGVLMSAPIINSQVRGFKEETYVLGARPADEQSLESWARAQPGVVSFATARRGDKLWIRSEYLGSASQKPTVAQLVAEMRRLGYEIREMHGGFTGLASGNRELLTNTLALASILAGMQIAFCVVGLNRIRAAARRNEPLPPLFAGRSGRALMIGVGGGLGLLLLGLINQQVLTALLGHPPPGAWDASVAMSAETKLIFLLFGAVGAPIAEEIFFRGYVFGRFKAAGRVGFGMLFSSLLFGVVHFSDPYNVPGICVFGVCLAWLYHRTGSLLAPVTAHLLNNAIAILWMILS